MKTLLGAIESYFGRFLLWVTAILLIAILYAQKTATPRAWQAGDWEAFATVVTASVALLATAVAIVQLRDARQVRWEQALPYVAAYLDPDPTDPALIYLTIKNFGATVAKDLVLEITPEPQRSDGVGGGPLKYPRTIPALVPGQEWRTFWDFSVYRYQAQMTDHHVLIIGYADSRGERHAMHSVLDWESYTFGRRWIGRKSIHHVGESLSKIEKSVGRLAKAANNQSGTGFADPADVLHAVPGSPSTASDVVDLLIIDDVTTEMKSSGSDEAEPAGDHGSSTAPDGSGSSKSPGTH